MLNLKNLFTKRLVIAKTVGFIVGLLGFLLIPLFFPDASLMLRFGILLWYTLVGVMIGIFGIMDRHPVLNFRMNAWMRGIILGAFMNLALVLIAYDTFAMVLATAPGSFTGGSPFWFVFEGAIVGLVIDLIATKYAGEGFRLVTDFENTQA